jgi:beta-galactosidase
LPDWATDPELDVLLHVDWAGDVGQLRVDDRIVTDRFWDGSRWTISLLDAGYRAGSTATLHLLPLAVGSTVHLPADAGDRLVAAEGQLLAVDAVRVVARRAWSERS